MKRVAYEMFVVAAAHKLAQFLASVSEISDTAVVPQRPALRPVEGGDEDG